MADKKLLVADDSLTIQKVIRLALSNEGYEIQTVSDGHDAAQQISLFRPNIVLIDISLPGKSAFEVKREINNFQDFEEIRFVLMSSAFEKVDEVQMKEVGFHGNLTKPFDPSHLRQILLDALSQITQRRAEKTSLLSKTGSHSVTVESSGPKSTAASTPSTTPPQFTPNSSPSLDSRPLAPPHLATPGIEVGHPTDLDPVAPLETDLWDAGQDPATLSSLPSPVAPEATFAAPIPKKAVERVAGKTLTQSAIPPSRTISAGPSPSAQAAEADRRTATIPLVPPANRGNLSPVKTDIAPRSTPLISRPTLPTPAAPLVSATPKAPFTSAAPTTPPASVATNSAPPPPGPVKIKFPQSAPSTNQQPTNPYWSAKPVEDTPELPEVKLDESVDGENDIQELTSSTFLMNNSSEYEWNVNEPTLSPTSKMADQSNSLASNSDSSGSFDRTSEPTLAPVGMTLQTASSRLVSYAGPEAEVDDTALEADTPPPFDTGVNPEIQITEPDSGPISAFTSGTTEESDVIGGARTTGTLAETAQTAETGEVLGQTTPFSQSQLELLVRQEVQVLVEKVVLNLVPELAEKMIKAEIHRILSES